MPSPRMVARHINPREGDMFPTPPWVTRALVEQVIDPSKLKGVTILEPASGAGHMADTLEEYGAIVSRYDVKRWGTDHPGIRNYVTESALQGFDHTITNPPYSDALAFAEKALQNSNKGVALLVRVQFLESAARYPLFSEVPPTQLAFFSARIPFAQGRVVRKASVYFQHVWV